MREVPNLDAMSRDEIHEWLSQTKDDKDVPLGTRGYAWSKKTAMRLREEGRIELALRFEDKCDELYKYFKHQVDW